MELNGTHLIDTHCHLTVFSQEELSGVLERAAASGVRRMICIGATDGKTGAERSVDLATTHENVWATVGIHPHDAGNFQDLSAVSHLYSHPKVVGVGETGLDFFRDWSPVDAQYQLFRESIRLALRINKPLVIHCRDAQEETLAVLREEGASAVGGVFHCFSGDCAFADQVLALNFSISFTGNVTFKKATTLREVVKHIPLEAILLETDTPYMAPEPFRGRPSEPMHVRQVAELIASERDITLEELATATTQNAHRLFSV